MSTTASDAVQRPPQPQPELIADVNPLPALDGVRQNDSGSESTSSLPGIESTAVDLPTQIVQKSASPEDSVHPVNDSASAVAAFASDESLCPDTKNLPPDAVDRPGDWSQFRGDGQGHGSGEGLPLRWNEKTNIVWKVPISGMGWSSPVIVQDRIWLTTAVVAEKSLHVLCLDARSGQTLNDVEVFRKESLWKIHRKNSHATPTPVIVDDRCYVHFGSHGTAALDKQGTILWKTELDYYHHHGPAGSPVIVDGAAVIACDGFSRSFYDNRVMPGVTDPQFVVALETATGDVRWRRKRDGAHSYATPLVIEVNGRTQVVSPGGNGVVAYDPATGDEIWSCRYEGYSVVPRPVYGHGLVFVCTGYDVPTLLAIRPDGKGDVTDTHVAWKATQAVPLNPSPILVGDHLYTISDLGVVSCLVAKTGKVLRRRRVGGNHSASPIFADGRLYFLDEVGATTVVSPGTECQILARNLVRGKTQASLAVSGKALFLRSDTHLYRIEETNPKAAADGEMSIEGAQETDDTRNDVTDVTPEKYVRR